MDLSFSLCTPGSIEAEIPDVPGIEDSERVLFARRYAGLDPLAIGFKDLLVTTPVL